LASKCFVFSLSSLKLLQNNGQFLIIHCSSLLSASSPSPPLIQCNHNPWHVIWIDCTHPHLSPWRWQRYSVPLNCGVWLLDYTVPCPRKSE
jgi:hypothetical protein